MKFLSSFSRSLPPLSVRWFPFAPREREREREREIRRLFQEKGAKAPMEARSRDAREARRSRDAREARRSRERWKKRGKPEKRKLPQKFNLSLLTISGLPTWRSMSSIRVWKTGSTASTETPVPDYFCCFVFGERKKRSVFRGRGRGFSVRHRTGKEEKNFAIYLPGIANTSATRMV